MDLQDSLPDSFFSVTNFLESPLVAWQPYKSPGSNYAWPGEIVQYMTLQYF